MPKEWVALEKAAPVRKTKEEYQGLYKVYLDSQKGSDMPLIDFEQFIELADSMISQGSIWLNHIYQVQRIEYEDCLVHLSIKRIDKAPSKSWRDFQLIKNQLIGPDCEAVELYPKESRLVDTANQYHLWGYSDNRQLPFGMDSGRVTTNLEAGGSKQAELRNTA